MKTWDFFNLCTCFSIAIWNKAKKIDVKLFSRFLFSPYRYFFAVDCSQTQYSSGVYTQALKQAVVFFMRKQHLGWSWGSCWITGLLKKYFLCCGVILFFQKNVCIMHFLTRIEIRTLYIQCCFMFDISRISRWTNVVFNSVFAAIRNAQQKVWIQNKLQNTI